MPFETDSAVFTLPKDWLPKLFTLLREQRTTRREEMDRIADTFGDPVQLAEFYVEPDCQQFNPADDDEDDVRYIVREPIFSRLEYFFGGHSLTGGHQMFLLADSGMGKSSALMMLKLAHLNLFWPKGYECALLKIGPDTVDTIRVLGRKRNTILLLDGLDEDPEAWGRIGPRLIELLTASRNFWRVIISCRTQFFSAGEDPFNRRGKVEVGGFICPVIYLSLFSESQVEQYLQKRFPKNPTQISKATALLSRMRSLRFRPMLLAHIEDLLLSETKEWTEYSIYEALVKAWLLRERAKALPGRKMPEVTDLWNACAALALHLHKTGKREVSQDDLEVFMAAGFRRLNKLDIGGRSLLNKNSAGAFRFSHYSIQEFLVARAVITSTMGLVTGSIRVTDQLMRFIFSWMLQQSERVRAMTKVAVLNLEGADLLEVDVSHWNLHGGSLKGANLGRTKLHRTVLASADLRDANFKRAELISADLNAANLEEADFSFADLSKAQLRYAILTKAKFDNADLPGADLSGANLIGARIVKANLTNSILDQANLRGANLSGADLTGADLQGVDFRKVDLSNCLLRRAWLGGADLSETAIHKSMLTGAVYDEDTVWPSEFDHASHLVIKASKRSWKDLMRAPKVIKPGSTDLKS